MSRSRRRRSPSPAKPHHAGVAYRMDATVVEFLQLETVGPEKTYETWSVMVNPALRRTPRTLSVVTFSMNGCDGGCMDLVLARVTTSSFVLDGWIFLLFVSAHVLMLSYSSVTSYAP